MHHNDPITVHFQGGIPAAFSWRGRAYHVRAIKDRWNGTAPSQISSSPEARGIPDATDFWQVQAVLCGGEDSTYELRYTPQTGNWHLTATGNTRHNTP